MRLDRCAHSVATIEIVAEGEVPGVHRMEAGDVDEKNAPGFRIGVQGDSCRLYRFTNNTANHGSRDLERLALHRSLAH